MSSTPPRTLAAARKDFKLSIGPVMRLIARWSYETMLLRYLTCRTVSWIAKTPLISLIAVLFAQLLSVAIFYGLREVALSFMRSSTSTSSDASWDIAAVTTCGQNRVRV
jgi:hypothetical protein